MVFNTNFNDISVISWRSVYWWRKLEYPEPAADAKSTQTRSRCSEYFHFISYPSGAPEFTPGFPWGSCYSIFSFVCVF
jgi:hypothetical protein